MQVYKMYKIPFHFVKQIHIANTVGQLKNSLMAIIEHMKIFILKTLQKFQ